MPESHVAAMQMVEDAGYWPVEARDSNEAIKMLEVRTDIRIVFSDIDMPGGIDGTRLAAAIRDRWPPIEIILTSGNVRPAAEMMPDRSIFLPKPYTEDQLVRLLTATVSALPF